MIPSHQAHTTTVIHRPSIGMGGLALVCSGRVTVRKHASEEGEYK
jgi:hypothetical protein